MAEPITFAVGGYLFGLVSDEPAASRLAALEAALAWARAKAREADGW